MWNPRKGLLADQTTAFPDWKAADAFLAIRRHCERSEAIQDPSAERLWIASLRSQ
jgi:hypothetical protein